MSRLALLLACLLVAATPAAAQSVDHGLSSLGRARHVIMPPADCFPIDGRPGVRIEAVSAEVVVTEQAATTLLDIVLVNTSGTQEEAVLLLPVPEGAAVSTFMFDGMSSEAVARVMPREEARRLYDAIVAKVRDPALLEFAGFNLIRSSVFPVPARGHQRLRLTYEQILPAEGDRIDYILPRSESLQQRAPWNISVDIKAKSPIATVYSPSHDVSIRHVSPTHTRITLLDAARTAPGPFRLSWLLKRDGLSASLMAYPDPSVGGGYFLLLAGIAPDTDPRPVIRREVTIVIDKSGSMAGEKMDQAKAAALQVLEALDDGEAFNIIDYSHAVATFAEKPVVKNRESTLEARKYIASIKPNGGTNIHDALLEALRPEPIADTLPIVLFLTDGLPTVGRTSEVEIRRMVEAGNTHRRRIFTFGVGNDVNVPLLDKVADLTRAMATYVPPAEDVEVKVAGLFKRLSGPVLSDIAVKTIDSSGASSTRLIGDVIPSPVPDLFEDDQIVLLGQYKSEEPVTFVVEGNDRGRQRTFSFTFDLRHATTKNAFVPRLWASRRIAYLVDQVRQAGAELGLRPAETGATLFNDPRFKELADEILRLSTQFGILTEYTAFLATDGTDLGNWNQLRVGCSTQLESQAVRSRSGPAAVSQGMNFNAQKGQSKLNYDNRFVNQQLQEVEFTTVQQVCDKAFFNRGARWIDSNLVATQKTLEPDRTIAFGSPEHLDLMRELQSENRVGILSLRGEILIDHHGERILITSN
jgi:Ca-activated chloride channel homolog